MPFTLSQFERGRRMAAALKSLSKLGALCEITDPVAWQRQIREDRELLGREESTEVAPPSHDLES